MGKKLETATNGRISIQMYPSMQLGGEKEIIEQARVGALQIARISVGAMGPVVDDLNVFNLPFIFRDEAHMRKVIDGSVGAELLEKINSNPASRIVGVRLDGRRRSQRLRQEAGADARRPEGPEDPHDGQPIFVETMNAMGASGVAMGLNELYGNARDGRRSTARGTTRRRCWRRTITSPEGLHADGPPDHSGDLHLLQAHLGRSHAR